MAITSTSRKFSKKQLAAILIAEDKLTDEAIGEQVGVTRRTITTWRNDPEFQALISDAQEHIKAEALKLPIANKLDRIRELNDLNERNWRIIHDRAARYTTEAADSPEGALAKMYGDYTPTEAATGMLVKQMKISASGKTVTEWVYDKALASEIRDTQKQAAQELGQWTEQSKVDMDAGVRIEVVGVADEDMP